MRQFLISGFILALLVGTAPATADSDHRRGGYSNTGGYETDRAGPHHRKFLTSRYRGDDHYRGDRRRWGQDRKGYKGHRSHRDNGWRGHPGKKHHGWKKGKKHGWKDGYHGNRSHGHKHL